MNHDFVRIIAQILVYMLVLMQPVLWILYTDRFRKTPTPDQYAILFLVVVLIGVFLFVPAISIVAATALLAFGSAWLYARYALAGVSYVRTLRPARLFPGDRASLAIRLENRKLLPLAWVSITDPLQFRIIRAKKDLDRLVQFSGGVQEVRTGRYALVNRAAVGPFQALVRTYEVTGHHRGVYTLEPGQVECGDPFGVFRREAVLGGRTEIIVYPRIYRPDELALPFQEILGEVVTRRALYEDPTLLAGSREYQPGDPLNRVNWKATARTGELQVRVSDPSTTAQLMIALNLNTSQHLWQGVDPERMEASISVAASLAVWAIDKDFPVGIRANGAIPGASIMPRIAPSANPRQVGVILEHLARLAFWGTPPEQVLMDEVRRLATGTSLVYVTSMITPEVVRVLLSPKLRSRVSVIYCGRYAAPVVPGLPVHLASPPLEPERAAS